MVKESEGVVGAHGLHKTLQEKSAKPTGMSDEDWEKLDLKAASTNQLCLAYKVMYNMMMKKRLRVCGKVRNIVYDKEPLQ